MEIENMIVENHDLPKAKTQRLSLESLDNEPGFYQYVIRPMLYPGHEGELCTWLKEMGLLQRSLRCINSTKNSSCNVPMKWTQARIVDKYQWKCNECLRKRPIREESFFKQMKCSLTLTLRIILGWCKDFECDDLVSILNIKSFVIKKAYEACSQIAEGYVKTHSLEWRMGGKNVIVIIDLYPDGCAKVNGSNPEYQNNNPIPILCLAEAKDIPTNYWFHVINSSNHMLENKQALKMVQTMVKPGSILITDPNSKICSYKDLVSLKEYTVININDLSKHNRPSCTLLNNLETIWAPAINICEEAQYYPHQQVEFFLYNQLWRRKFAKTPSSAIESLLHHIADHYPEIDFL